MIYDILYTNKSYWKDILLWEKTINDDYEIWSADRNYYKDIFVMHGNKSLYNFGHHGILACNMVGLFGAYSFLKMRSESDINITFIDDIIEKGIDLYQAFLHTKEGKRVTDKRFITETDLLCKYFKTLYNIEYYSSQLIEVVDKERANLYDYDKWLLDNISFYTDKAENTVEKTACIITVNYECFVLYFDYLNTNYYLFDSQGRGLSFFRIPSNQNKYLFLTKKNAEIPYSNMSGYIIKSKEYSKIVEYIKKTLPYSRNFRSTYIVLS